MSEIDVPFLKAVQREGWTIKGSDGEVIIAGCPRSGCGLVVKMRPGAAIPRSCGPSPALTEIGIASFNDMRRFLQDRGEELGLSIPEIEDLVGLAGDHLAKFYSETPQKLINVVAFIDLCDALGLRISLSRGPVPDITLRKIAEGQDNKRRRINHRYFQARRKARRGAQAEQEP